MKSVEKTKTSKRKREVTKRMKKVTMKDIAQRLGLSINTVSHALNDREDISENTKKRVRDMAKELGYALNLSAKSLRLGLTRMVALLHDDPLNPYYAVMTAYLKDELAAYGYGVMTFISDSFDKRALDSISMRGVDGIISFLQPEALDETNNTIPSLIIGSKSQAVNIDGVCCDDAEGGCLAARYLSGKGCGNVLFLGYSKQTQWQDKRKDGFMSQCAKIGIKASELLLEDSVAAGEQQLKESLKKVDGVFCCNDIIALGLASVLEKQKIDNIYIAAFDDVFNEIACPCKITSVGYDKQKMAQIAAQRIDSFIKDGVAVKEEASDLPVLLHERN